MSLKMKKFHRYLFQELIISISPLINLLNAIIKDNYIIKVLSQDQVKVQAKTIEACDIINKSLIEKNTEFYIYQKKQDKPF